jgi:hypothetical protein
MKYLKTYEGSGFGESYPGHIEPTPKFKIGDEVMVMYDLKQYNYPYGIDKGDIVTITDFWIYANGTISYHIDSPKLREIKKGIDTRNDYFSEFHFEYEWKVNANKYNI